MATTTFGEFKKKVIRICGDTIQTDGVSGELVYGKQLSADLLKDSCHAALHAITGRQWKSAIFETVLAGTAFDLPADLIEIDAVYDNYQAIFIPKLPFEMGTTMEGNSWIDTPEGKITFTTALVASSGAKIYYLADWKLPDEDSEVLECPEFCLTALVLYGASYVFLRKASQQSELAQFKTRVDAGVPTDIPAAATGNFLLKRFENEMARMPMKQKGTR